MSEPAQPEPTRSAPKLTRSANSPTCDDSSSATAADTPASESAALFVVSKPMPSQARGKLPPIQKKLPASPSKLLQKAPALPGFEEADSDNDSKLDRDEFAAFIKKTRSNAALQPSERHPTAVAIGAAAVAALAAVDAAAPPGAAPADCQTARRDVALCGGGCRRCAGPRGAEGTLRLAQDAGLAQAALGDRRGAPRGVDELAGQRE